MASFLPLPAQIALRFSRGKKRGAMVSMISIISTFGIALGVAVLIIGLSAMNGFERELKQRVLAVVAHGEVFPEYPELIDLSKFSESITQTSGVAAAAPFVVFTGLVENGTKLQALQFKGIDVNQEPKISALPEFVSNNAWQNFKPNEQQIILGQGIAREIGAEVGSFVTILIPATNNDTSSNSGNSSNEIKLQQPTRVRVKVVGLITLGGMIDHSLALLPIEDAQTYLNNGNTISGIGLRANDAFNAQVVTEQAANNTGESVRFDSWISTYGFMYRDIQTIRGIMYLAMILVMAVACFNIVSTLVVAVKEKRGDIAILRTLGSNDRFIRSIFIWYGLFSAAIGAAIGVIIGVLTALYLTPIIQVIENIIGRKLLSGDIYFVDFLPSELHILDVALVFGTSLVLSFLASWYPARRASAIDPARVLSGQ